MADSPISTNVQSNVSTLPALVSNVTSQFIVRPTDNPSLIGVSGFIFDLIGTEEFSLDSDITDHYTENNSAIQDHIALRPEKFMLSGYVGELSNNFSNFFLNILTEAQSFGTVLGLAPKFSIQATQVYNSIAAVTSSVAAVVNQAQNIYSLFSGVSTTANKQQNAFQYFYNLWLSRQLCEVETPWGILQNMAIENVRVKQDEQTRIISDFTVTFKAIRFANTLSLTSTGADLSTLVGQPLQTLQETPDNSGITSGLAVPSTTLVSAASTLIPVQFNGANI